MRGHDGVAVEDFRPAFLAKTTMARKAADAAIAATKRALVEMGRKHAREVRLVHPAHTTMDCATCGARTKSSPVPFGPAPWPGKSGVVPVWMTSSVLGADH
jgi:hypothetical protein